MQIRLNPFDTLFVRDGKPFSMGDEVWANGLFPPPPSVIYGALRTAFFSQNLNEIEKAGGIEDPTRNIQVKQIFLLHKEHLFLPSPYDIVESKALKNKNKENLPFVLSLEIRSFIGSLDTDHVLTAPKDSMPVTSLGGNAFISLEDFADYLNGDEEIGVLKHDKNPLFLGEPKIGIQKSRSTGSSSEGRLYRVELFRPMPETSIWVEWETSDATLSIPEKGILKVGGEGKAVSYTLDAGNVNVPLPSLTGNLMKVVFATPAVFEQGWLPSGINPKTLKGNWCGQEVKILTAAFDRPLYMGGFRMKTKHQQGGPKPMRRAVAAGAVYYLEVEGDIHAAAQAFHGQCISEFDMAQQGYGLAYVGKVKKG
jgi:CRISPR-associated protein Cmr3